MADPFVAEIRMFGFNFAPINWAFCNGQTMPVQVNTQLFALIGTIYGGNGQSTFMLPDMRSRTPTGSSSSNNQGSFGVTSGSEGVSLNSTQLPAHSHTANVNILTDASQGVSTPSATTLPTTVFQTATLKGQKVFVAQATPDAAFNPAAILPAGNSLPHENRQPFLAVNFCICLNGLFPSFN